MSSLPQISKTRFITLPGCILYVHTHRAGEGSRGWRAAIAAERVGVHSTSPCSNLALSRAPCRCDSSLQRIEDGVTTVGRQRPAATAACRVHEIATESALYTTSIGNIQSCCRRYERTSILEVLFSISSGQLHPAYVGVWRDRPQQTFCVGSNRAMCRKQYLPTTDEAFPTAKAVFQATSLRRAPFFQLPVLRLDDSRSSARKADSAL